MTRSVWKGPFVHPSLLKKIDKLKDAPNKKPIKTWSRNSTIIPDFVGHSFMIHNGKTFIPITISEEMVGCGVQSHCYRLSVASSCQLNFLTLTCVGVVN